MRRDDEDVAAPPARPLLWVDRPSGVERLIRVLYLLCALLVAFELFWHRHAYVPGEEMKGYHAIVGFFAFLLIVLGAKQLRRLIRRDEDHYGAASVNAEPYPEAGLERLDARHGDDSGRLLAVRDGEVVGKAAAGTVAGTVAGRAAEADAADAAADERSGDGSGERP